MDKENRILLIHKKEENFVIHKNKYGHWQYYAKWNKSDWERQILYNITCMLNINKTLDSDTENGFVIVKGERWQVVIVKGVKVVKMYELPIIR